MTAFSEQAFSLGGQQFLLRETRSSDEAQVVALVGKVFGEFPPTGWYAWKYGNDGLMGRALGLWTQDGRLVAHCGGFPHPLSWYGRPVAALQIGDVMVAPEMRGFLTRRNPFQRLCNAYFQQWVGHGRPYPVCFGFPNARHSRLGQLLGLYTPMCDMQLLTWPVQRMRLPLGWQARNIAPADGSWRAVVERAARNHSRAARGRIARLRDADYIARRFVRRPGFSYRFVELSFVGITNALAVALPTSGGLRWLDFIGASRALPAAAAALQNLAAALGLAQVQTWASPPAQKDLMACGAQAAGEVADCVLVYPSICEPAELARHGWWLAGDTDFL